MPIIGLYKGLHIDLYIYNYIVIGPRFRWRPPATQQADRSVLLRLRWRCSCDHLHK